jgi:hypothetical protein
MPLRRPFAGLWNQVDANSVAMGVPIQKNGENPGLILWHARACLRDA